MPARPHARVARYALALAVAVSLNLPHLASPTPARAATLPAGFSESVTFSGLTNPTVVRFAADGRVFVAEKSGLIKVFDSLTDTSPTIFADLRTNVHNFWDRGLLGMALAPNFPTDPSVYVLYAYDAEVGGNAPRWGTPGQTSDPCPTPPGATSDGCVVTGRLSRLNAAGAETPLITDWCQQYPSHSVGSLQFGADGFLYVSGGDGASFTFADYGQGGGSSGSPTPRNPCLDPGGSNPSPPTAEGGALRSQDLRTASDPTSLDGAILRIDPATGQGAPGNPLAGSSDANARRIIGDGLRNPFRFTIRPGTNEVWLGDVGWTDWEEIDRLIPSTSVANFGWPCYEGAGRQGGYDGANLSICENLYAAGSGAVVSPYYTYNHANKVVTGESCPTGSSSIAGMAFASGGTYPSQYAGALFFADYSRDCIWVMFAGGNGLPDPNQRATFAAGVANPVGLEIGPGGDLFYVDFDGGTIRRISFSSSNEAPTAAVSANPTSGPSPLAVSFSGAGSTDPDGDPLTYAWDLDGDGQFDDATGQTASRTYTNQGTVVVGLLVSDGQGGTDTAFVPVTVTSGGATVTYLSALTPTFASNGWGPFENDRSNGETGAADGGPITLAGVIYTKGLGTHAASDLRYTVPTGTCSFLASIGLDDEVGSNGSLTFQVLAGSTSLYLSPTMTGASATVPLSLAIPAGTTTLRLLVSPGATPDYDHADWADARFSCSGGGPPNSPPQPFIDTPAAGTTFVVGQTINFTGHATDTQDGTLPAAGLSWRLIQQHCPSTCHSHVIQSWPGIAGGSFGAPDHDYPSYLDLELTATDSGGMSATVVRRLDPQTVTLTFASSPSGLQLTVGSATQTAPFTRTVIVGSANSVSAPSPQSLGGTNYQFSTWSDGGAASHTITAPASATTYTATYTPVTGGPTVTYLSNLTPTFATNGWGPFENDRSNGEQGAADGLPITLAGVVYAKGLGTHAASDLRYTVPSGTCSFLASIGLDDEVGSNGSLTFQVFAGSTSLYLSPTLTGASATVPLNLAIPAGTTTLRLLVSPGASTNYDHADWADARFSCTSGGPPTTVTLTFASSPSGLQLTVNGTTQVTPFTRVVNVGSANSVSAPSPQSLGGTNYQFSTWSDGGAASHTITAPASATTYTATYTPVTGGPTVTYLSNLTPTFATNGWGPFENDRSNGEQGAADGLPITLAGVVYAKGLGTHAASDLRYTVPSGTCSFLASIGLDDEVGSNGSLTFQVFAGSTSLYLSPTLTGASATVPLNLAIPAGTTTLRLLVSPGASTNYDHADWADARFSCT